MWIVGGNIYNYFEEKEIKNNIIDLEHELYAIEILKLKEQKYIADAIKHLRLSKILISVIYL